MRTTIILALLFLFGTITLTAQNLDVRGKAKITEMDIVKFATQNVVKTNDGTLAIREYAVGDLVHGGIVFWVDETGEHGLVCAPSDQSVGAIWSATSAVTMAQSKGILGGRMNTVLIVSLDRSGTTAAGVCSLLDLGGFDDWFLPSFDELMLMYNNLQVAGIGGFSNAFYWSSTEFGAGSAYMVSFDTTFPGQDTNGKDDQKRVRAVRRF